jgi:hypothetical protein
MRLIYDPVGRQKSGAYWIAVSRGLVIRTAAYRTLRTRLVNLVYEMLMMTREGPCARY